MFTERLSIPGRKTKILVEFEHLDTGIYGWRAEAPEYVGIREFGASRNAVKEAILQHVTEEIKAKKAARKGETKTFTRTPGGGDYLWLPEEDFVRRPRYKRTIRPLDAVASTALSPHYLYGDFDE